MAERLYSPEKLVNILRQRLALRVPQADALKILKDVIETHIDLHKACDVAAQLEIIRENYPEVTDFERDFPSLCFALATGVGKTRLMGAFIAYLYLMGKSRHFIVIAPNTTIYQKLIDDFTPGAAKYVFQGVSELVKDKPVIVTGDDWDKGAGVTASETSNSPIIHIFNIQKIDREEGKIRSFKETIGESYFNFLSDLPDLVVLMDEAHRYRAKAGMDAIDDLKPVLGLEVTATPRTSGAGGSDFKNIIYHYPLANALRDGFVKSPAAITLQDFNPDSYNPEQLQQRKLKDAMRWHSKVKAEIAQYARDKKVKPVHPFILVVAQNTAHATEIRNYIESDDFYGGDYREKVIEIHSNQIAVESENAMQRLIELEHSTDTEIVIHVNKLKEGWDVSNLFTIVPLRASASDILTEQTLGRGLRLPYGKLTGNEIIDTLGIVAHDRFNALIAAANEPGSILKKGIELDSEDSHLTSFINIPSKLSGALVGKLPTFEDGKVLELNEDGADAVLFGSQMDKRVVCQTLRVVREFGENESKNGLKDLSDDSFRDQIKERVRNSLSDQRGISEDRLSRPVEDIVTQCLDEVLCHTIEVPEIIISPSSETSFKINDFYLERLNEINYQPEQGKIIARNLVNVQAYLPIDAGMINEKDINPFEWLVSLLSQKQQIDYEEDAELLNKLVNQVIRHLDNYLDNEIEVKNVVAHYGQNIADFIHRQIEAHITRPDVQYKAEIKKGFKLLRPQIFSARDDRVKHYSEAVHPRRDTPKYAFMGFQKCCYPVQKFQSDPERQFADMLEDDARADIIRWMKPALNQFSIDLGNGNRYNPDFIIEAENAFYIAEVKAENEIGSLEVKNKARAAIRWVSFVNEIGKTAGKREWFYLLIPDNEIEPAATFNALINRRVVKSI